MVHKHNISNQTRTFYYNPKSDVFTNKMEFLELNGNIDAIIVDVSNTSQDNDIIFASIYG